MRAIVYSRYGSPDVMRQEEIEQPSPAAGEVLVRVRGAAANPYDWHFVRGEPYVMRLMFGLRAPKRQRLGVDFAGVVEALGVGVTTLAIGDEVYGMGDGAYADYVCVPEHNAARKPLSLGFDVAAAVPLAGLTALQGLRDAARLQAGERVLIVGASGGVGTFAVQLGKYLGAHVTAVCSAKNLDLVRSLGADEAIDYAARDFASSGEKYAAVLQLGGQDTPARLRRALTARGRLVLSSGESHGKWIGPIARIFAAKASAPFVSQEMIVLDTQRSQADLVELARLVDAGVLHPIIDRKYPLSEAAEAVRYVERAHSAGKVLVSLD